MAAGGPGRRLLRESAAIRDLKILGLVTAVLVAVCAVVLVLWLTVPRDDARGRWTPLEDGTVVMCVITGSGVDCDWETRHVGQ